MWQGPKPPQAHPFLFPGRFGLTPKTVAMIGHAASLETLSTTTEKEALLLEASLIKKHRPHYNIVLRDDKQYVLFRIAKDAPYPRLEVVRQARRDNARYFGPFGGRFETRQALDAVCAALRLPTCSRRFPRAYRRPTALSEFPHGPVRRILPAGDDSRSV